MSPKHLVCLSFLSIAALACCGVPASQTAQIPETRDASADLPTPITIPAPSLPDLLPLYVRIELETGGACSFASTSLGTRVVVKNAGQVDAGPFLIQVSNSRKRLDAGLAAGHTASLWFPEYVYGVETVVVVDVASQIQESDESNNTLSQMLPIPTLPPTCTPVTGRGSLTEPAPATQEIPPPTATATPTPVSPPTYPATPSATSTPTPRPTERPAVTVRESQVILTTYPYEQFTKPAWSQAFNMPYTVFDRAAYEASNPRPTPVTYRTVILENELLRLTFLPDLGGRLYEVFYKPTGQRETYRNPVLKPSPWGPPEQGGWLAAGGFEWCVPVEEHGYEWGMPWLASVSQDPTGATLTLRDSLESTRLRTEISVRLEAGSANFTIRARLENPTAAVLPVKFWINAMLAPGGRNAPSAHLRFVLPQAVTSVTIHSRGDDSLPPEGQRMPWPTVGGRDFSQLGNWSRWLGFFEDPAVGEFIAVYDMAYDEGIVRVFPSDLARGAKVFAFGWSDPIPSANWTDDGSAYVEIHGGLAPTFDDAFLLAAGSHVEWTEAWYPVAGLGGLQYANHVAALNLQPSGSHVLVAAAAPQPLLGRLAFLLDGQERWRTDVSLLPGRPFRNTVSLGADVPDRARLTLRLTSPRGVILAEYSGDFALK